MLVEHPHDLAGVHGGAAAQGDDDIGAEGGHGRGALLGAGEGGIGGYLIEAGVLDPHLVQLLFDGLDVAVLIQEGIGDDERLFLVHDGAELIQSDRHAALLEVDLFRRPEPQHVLSPLGHGLDVEQVLDAHVLADRVAAPGAAAQRQGRSQLKVIQVADAAWEEGVLTRMRQVFIAAAKRPIFSFSFTASIYREEVWP